MQLNNPGRKGTMADGVISFLLEKLTTLLEEEGKDLKGVKEEIEHIRDEFDRMTAFLKAADAMNEPDPELKIWVKQVQDVAYDTETIIDRFVIRASQKQYQGNKLNVVFCKFVFWIGKWKFNHGIASDIHGIKARIQSIAEGHQRYQYKLNMPHQGITSRVANNSNRGYEYDRRGDALLLDEVELVGIKGRKQELIQCIMEGDSRLKIVSVVGMGGLGKTTLVRKVYDDAAFRNQFKTHAWINVSESFKVLELLRDIIRQLFDEIKQAVPQGVNDMDSNRLKEVIKEFLQHRRYVLVFDDIWKIQAWEAVKYALPNKNNGSCVIITTRLSDVASYSCTEPNGYVYELKPLSPEESLTLFCREAFQGSSCPPHLERICQSIWKKCGGLPLAIVAIAGLLASKDQSRIEEWLILDQSLGAELEGNTQLESLRTVLSLSFHDLPFYLKSCFLYLSIFPEDSTIGKNRLLRLWIMEGFVKPIQGRTLEEVAEGYLNELVNRNLIIVVKSNDDGSIKLIRVHDFLREMILSTSREQNFAITANDQTAAWPHKIRRLAIHGTLEKVWPKRYGSQLRSFLTFGEIDPQSMTTITTVLSCCNMIKVLDLPGAPLETFPKVIVKMIHLRYLSMRGTRVKKIPKSIQKLQNLETLDLKNTYVSELPVEILKLQHLRYLLVYRHVAHPYLPYDCLLGFKAVKGIGKLTSLQKLSFIEATPGSGIFSQIAMLKELRRVSILKLKMEDGKALCSCIEKLKKLRSLSLQSAEEDEILDMQHLSSPPLYLQRLYLSGRLANFPNWIQSLHSLVKIYFRWSRLEDDPLPYLQDLPNLIHLEFLDGHIGAELRFKAGKFQRLKLLDLDKLEALRWVVVEERAMPQLEKLLIQRCSMLQSVPTGIEGLTNIKVLEFFDMPDPFIMKLQPGKVGEDHCKVAHIPEVNYTYWRDGGWETYPLDREVKDESSSTPQTSAIRTYGRRNWL